MSPSTRAALFLACLIGGGVAGWASIPWTGRAGEGGTAPPPPSPRHADRPASTTAAPRDREGLLREIARLQPAGGGLEDILSRWTDDELSAALDAIPHDPDTALAPGVALAIFREAFRRDMDRTLVWYSGLSAFHRRIFSADLAHEWPVDRAAEGFEFLLKYRADFHQQYIDPLLEKNITAASASGPAAVMDFLARWNEAELSFNTNSYSVIPFAPGFDFASLLRDQTLAQERRLAKLRTGFIAKWHERDGDAAFQWMLDNQGPVALSSLDSGMPNIVVRAMAWLGARLPAMSPAQRTAYYDGMADEWARSPGSVGALLAGVEDPAVVKEIHTYAAQGIFNGETSDTLTLIKNGFPGTEERLRFLETLTVIPPPPGSIRQAIPPDITEIQTLRETLIGWEADEARVDAIIHRLSTLVPAPPPPP